MTREPEANSSAIAPNGTAPPTRRRFQFSLIALLWLTTLVACLLALGMMYRDLQIAKTQLQAARDEVQKYRGEMGYLKIVDPNKIHLRALGQSGEHWAWRFHLPERHRYRLLIASGALPDHELPVPNNRSIRNLSPGEYVLSAFAEPGLDGKWRLHSQIFNNGLFYRGRASADDEIPALDKGFETGLGDLCGDVMITEPNERVRLLGCHIVVDEENSPAHSTKQSEGFMIWIEEAK